jgi:hypothetical protein
MTEREVESDGIRFEHDGARAILPRALERELEPAIGAALEPVLRDGRTGDVATQPLELPSVPSVDPPMLGDRRGRIGLES